MLIVNVYGEIFYLYSEPNYGIRHSKHILLHWNEKPEQYKHVSQTLHSNDGILHSKHVLLYWNEKIVHYVTPQPLWRMHLL